MKIFTLLLLFLLLVNNVSANESLMLFDENNVYKDSKIIVYKNGTYLDTYNYSQNFMYQDGYNYTIIINEDIIDKISDKGFALTFFDRFGYLMVSLFIIICCIGVLVFVYKKAK